MALDGARTCWWPQNMQWSKAGGGGAPCTRGQSKREGEGVWKRAQLSEGRWASRARAQGRGQRTRGRGHGGEIVGNRLETADRWGQRDRERERARGKERHRQLGPTEQRESEGVSALGLAPTGGAHLSGTEGTQAQARARAGLAWAEMAFSFFPKISIAFSIYFL